MSTGTATETILGTTGGRGNERKLGRCSKDTGKKPAGPEEAERQREVRSDDLPAVGRVARGFARDDIQGKGAGWKPAVRNREQRKGRPVGAALFAFERL